MNEKILSGMIADFMPEMIRGVHLDFFTRHSITQTQLFMLVAIRSYGQCSMSTLAKNMKISMPTVSGIMERLVRAGLAVRKTKAGDRRQVLVALTPKGEKFIGYFKGVMRTRWARVLKGLSPHEQEQFSKIISKLRRYLAGSES